MTTGPELKLDRTLAPGVLAVGLFGVMALIVLNTGFTEMSGYPEGISITAALGYAMFDFTTLQASDGVPGTEPFLISFLLIAVVLDAALDASIVLAKREESGEAVSALAGSDTDVGSDTDSFTAGTATDGGEAIDETDGGASR